MKIWKRIWLRGRLLEVRGPYESELFFERNVIRAVENNALSNIQFLFSTFVNGRGKRDKLEGNGTGKPKNRSDIQCIFVSREPEGSTTLLYILIKV